MKAFIYHLTCILIFIFSAFFITIEVLSGENDISERIKKIEKEMEKVKNELENGEKRLKKLKSKEEKVMAELDIQEKKIEAIHNNMRNIRKEEKTIKTQINSAEKNYDNSKKHFESRSNIYAERLRSMYRRQNISPVGMLFTAGSISSFLRGFKMLSLLAIADLNILNEMRLQTHEIKTSMHKLQIALKANMELAKTRKREQITLSNTSEKKRIILDEILLDEKLQEARNRKFEEEYKNSQAKLDKSIREMEKAKPPLPPSLEGYDFAQYKGKLSWPVNGKIVSKFGKVIDSKTKTATKNRGVEIETKLGEPVASIGNGQVVMTQFFRGYGNFVLIHHPPNYYTIYGHLSDILVNKDDIVSEGAIIGLAGNTGMIDNSSSRLVLEVLKGEQPENPLVWLRPERLRAGK